MSLIIPNTFATKTGDIQLSLLDENFTSVKTQIDPYVDNISIDSVTGKATILGGINGNVTGNVSGNITGNVTGNVSGNITGNVIGNVTGNVSGNAASVTNGVYTVGDQTIGGSKTFSSPILGNITGNISGTATLSGNSTIISGATLSSTNAGSIYAPGMVIQTIYKRVDSKDVVDFATAGSTGSFIPSLDTIITPKFANSLILIQMCLTYEVHHDTVFRLHRGATAIGINANDSNYWSGTWLPGYDADNSSTARTNHFFYMDQPSTTNATTYRLMIQSGGIGATTFYLNRPISSAGQQNYEVGISQVILQEIKQ